MDLRRDAAGPLAAVGNTPMIELRRIVPASGARVLVKWEPANPTGSNVVASLRTAERLPPNATVVTIAVDSGLRYLTTAPYA